MAKAMKVSNEMSHALRDYIPLPNTKPDAARNFTLILICTRGNANDAKVASVLATD